MKLPGLRKLSALKEKKTTITDEPDQHGPAAEVAAADVVEDARRRSSRAPQAGAAAVASVLTRGSGSVDGMPETFVGTPAVIAWTTSCCVVLLALVDGDVAPEPQHGDPVRDGEDVVQVVRDQDDGEPLVREALDELEHLLGLRDAERGGRLVEDHEPGVPHHRAGDGDRLALAAGEGRDRLADRADRRHREALHRLGRLRLHHRLLQPLEDVVRLAAEVHVLDDVEVVAEREVLVDDLDPELGGVLRPVDVDTRRRRTGPRRCPAQWVPATHLISVDLPAPLSPTSAITSPGRTSKSTSSSACTEPKLFEIPWSSSSGVDAVRSSSWPQRRWGRVLGTAPTRSLPSCRTSRTGRRRPSTLFK